MLENYKDYKECSEDFYNQLYKELHTPFRMLCYITEGEFADYEGYGFLDRCCIFISMAKIAIDDNVDIFEIQQELCEIFQSNAIDKMKEESEFDFDIFYNDYLNVQQEYHKMIGVLKK